MLELVSARDKQGETSQVHPGLLAAYLRDGFLPVLGEIPQQRANHGLAQLVTRATQSSGRVFVADETEKWAKVVKFVGIKPQ